MGTQDLPFGLFGAISSTGTLSCMLPFRAFAPKCVLITQLRIEQIPLMFKHLHFALFIHEKGKKNKSLSSGLPFSWDIWRYFFHRRAASFKDHLDSDLLAQKFALEHVAELYLGMLGRSAEVAPKPGHCCRTPASQLELLRTARAAGGMTPRTRSLCRHFTKSQSIFTSHSHLTQLPNTCPI